MTIPLPSASSLPTNVSELTLPEPSDEDLVHRAQRGDGWAEEALFRRHIGRASQLATRLVGRGSEAEDVVQDAFVIALERLSSLRDGTAFRPWLLRVVVHQAHRRYRKRRMLARLGFVRHDDVDALSSHVRADLPADQRVELAKLDLVLHKLSTSERFAWMLRYVEGYRLDEVAHVCGCSLATAKRRIASADQRVRRHVSLAEPVE